MFSLICKQDEYNITQLPIDKNPEFRLKFKNLKVNTISNTKKLKT